MKLSNSLKDLSSGQLPSLCQCSTGQRDHENIFRDILDLRGQVIDSLSFWEAVWIISYALPVSLDTGMDQGGGWGGQGDSALSAGGLVCTWDRVTPERRQRAAFIILSALTRREAEPLSIGVVRQKLKSCGRDTRTDAVTSPREIITDTQWIWIGSCSSCENGH